MQTKQKLEAMHEVHELFVSHENCVLDPLLIFKRTGTNLPSNFKAISILNFSFNQLSKASLFICVMVQVESELTSEDDHRLNTLYYKKATRMNKFHKHMEYITIW